MRHAGWLGGAAVAVASVAGAVLAPSSWWGVTFAAAVAAAMVALRGVVPAAYRDRWRGPVVIVSVVAACAAGVYAFAVAPFGPSPVAYAFLAVLLLALTWTVKDAAQVHGSARMQGEVYQAYLDGGRERPVSGRRGS